MDKPLRQIFFDTETTGIGRDHRILELGAVEAIDRQMTENTFHRLINPQRTIDEDAMKIHNITFEIIQDKPIFAEVVDDFIDYIKDAEIIIHNAPFDVGMINNEFNLLSKESEKNYGQLSDYCKITDSLEMARKIIKSGKRSLDALCDRFHIDRSERTVHSAVTDCKLLFHVYTALTSGQQELFIKKAKKKNKQQTLGPIEDYSHLKLPTVTVSEQELKLHEGFVEKYLTE
jgi:DNA polymerase-3 subunit epsilon